MKAIYALSVFLLATAVLGDVYMQSPGGSNGRLNEANANRNNAERLFDTQNNAKGGYCVAPAMRYYEGSLLSVEWTSQHGCGLNPNMYCNLVVQYQCSDSNAAPTALIRNGATTQTITENANGAVAKNGNGELLYGMHEPYSNFVACSTRQRNQGLWIADRNLNGNDATYTRQNNGGTQHGYECAEERDYYPYWAPSFWKDVAILTHDESWCEFYQKESQNVKSRFTCETNGGAPAAQIDPNACTQAGNKWVEKAAWGIPAPDCVPTPLSRDNHLGNTLDGVAATYNWTLPSAKNEPCIAGNNCNCVLRLRYNISTADLGPNGNNPAAGFIDWTSNKGAQNSITNDLLATDAYGFQHQLALDTSQFGRTFQDRTHVFHIDGRPAEIAPNARIYNINVKGKRGNIVETYPATEYDFAPTHHTTTVGDYVHFQWTGCDTNPAGNAGEGTAGTDRSNVIQLLDPGASVPPPSLGTANRLFENDADALYFAMAGQKNCLSYADLKKKNNNNVNQIEQDVANCYKLNAAPQHFNGGLIKMNTTDTFYYMSSRNNNFSNRGQKASITVKPLLPSWAVAVVVIGAALFVTSGVVAGLMLFAKSHPHSAIATAFSKI